MFVCGLLLLAGVCGMLAFATLFSLCERPTPYVSPALPSAFPTARSQGHAGRGRVTRARLAA